MHRKQRSRARVIHAYAPAAVALLLVSFTSVVRALEPDQIALVVNARVPAGRDLAEHYAQVRHIPPGRIIELELPVADIEHPNEEMPADVYPTKVVEPVRAFLDRNGLRDKVTCLVTFWGLPLRVSRAVNPPDKAAELTSIETEIAGTEKTLREQVAAAEDLAVTVMPGFKKSDDTRPDRLMARADAALRAAATGIAAIQSPEQRAVLATRFRAVLEQLTGHNAAVQQLAMPPLAALSDGAVTPQQAAVAADRLDSARQKLRTIDGAAADGRSEIRTLARSTFGPMQYLGVLRAQATQLNTAETEAALDSELSLLWWDQHYPRFRWVPNPLYWRNAGNRAPAPTLMVMRLDAPTVPVVRGLIDTAIRVEAQGLTGQVALDARGKPPTDPYGAYDQTIRNLADLLTHKSKLQVTLDDKEPLFAPGAVKDVALYCGWYSLHHYVAGCQFNPGAVGFHIASSELVSLRNANETGWVHGLLIDGVIGTLGPVAEPYLHSFPPADEFFPLLLTGQLSLAETYWATNPLASWMNTCIGDPLYRPYKLHPALNADDLPVPLRAALRFAAPATVPSSGPASAPATGPTTATSAPGSN